MLNIFCEYKIMYIIVKKVKKKMHLCVNTIVTEVPVCTIVLENNAVVADASAIKSEVSI